MHTELIALGIQEEPQDKTDRMRQFKNRSSQETIKSGVSIFYIRTEGIFRFKFRKSASILLKHCNAPGRQNWYTEDSMNSWL